MVPAAGWSSDRYSCGGKIRLTSGERLLKSPAKYRPFLRWVAAVNPRARHEENVRSSNVVHSFEGNGVTPPRAVADRTREQRAGADMKLHTQKKHAT